MYTKRNIVVLSSVLVVVLLFTTAWGVLDGVEDDTAWPPDLGPRMDGAWAVIAPGPNGLLVHNMFNTAQDPQGLRYTTIVEHTQCSASAWGAFPEANAQSQSMGLQVKTGPNAVKGTVLSYGLKVGGVEDEVIYIAVTSWVGEIVDEDHCTTKTTLSYYLPQQDADHDGLPDDGQEPVLCGAYETAATRMKLMPMCEPTPIPETPAP